MIHNGFRQGLDQFAYLYSLVRVFHLESQCNLFVQIKGAFQILFAIFIPSYQHMSWDKKHYRIREQPEHLLFAHECKW